MNKPSSSYRDKLLKRLHNPDYAVGYLNAVLEEDDPAAFLLALRDVADARGNLAELSREAELTRESFYKILSERVNPNLNSLHSILKSLGLHLQVAVR